MSRQYMSSNDARKFLTEAANYFSNRDIKGEDSAYWSNVMNAENCHKIIALIDKLEGDLSWLGVRFVSKE